MRSVPLALSPAEAPADPAAALLRRVAKEKVCSAAAESPVPDGFSQVGAVAKLRKELRAAA